MQTQSGLWLGRRLWRALPQTKSAGHRRMRGVDHTLKRLLAAHGMLGVGRQHKLSRLEHADDEIGCSIHGPRALTLFVVS
jgi:hypothetical protein